MTEAAWRKILNYHSLSPPVGERDLPRIIDILRKEQGLDEDDYPVFDRGTTMADAVVLKIDRLHKLGIFHGDLNLTNIVSDNGFVRFIDFEYTCRIEDINLVEVAKFLELESYGYPETVEGALARERDMPFV